MGRWTLSLRTGRGQSEMIAFFYTVPMSDLKYYLPPD